MTVEPVNFEKLGSKTAAGIRPKESTTPFYVVQRDLAHAMAPILTNAAAMTMRVCLPPDKEDLDVELAIDTINQILGKVYTDFRVHPDNGLNSLCNLTRWLQETNNPKAQEVYAVFCHMVLVSMFTFLYCAPMMAVSSPAELTTGKYDCMALTAMLSTLDDKDRKSFVKKFKQASSISDKFDIGFLVKASEDLIASIHANQQQRLKDQQPQLKEM